MIFKKRFLPIALATTFAMLIYAPASIQANQVSVTIDGRQVNFTDQGPTIVDGRTLVPVRGVFEELGFEVDWEQDTETARLTRSGHEVVLTIGSANFITNGESHTLDVPAQIIGGRTMLPIRAVLESVGYSVDWDVMDSADSSPMTSVVRISSSGRRGSEDARNEIESSLKTTIGITSISDTFRNNYNGLGNHFNGSFVSFDGEWYYFFNGYNRISSFDSLSSEMGYLFRVNNDFSTVDIVNDFNALWVDRYQNSLFVLNEDININLIRLSDNDSDKVILKDCWSVFIVNDYIYYIEPRSEEYYLEQYDEYHFEYYSALCRIGIDGTDQETLAEDVISFYVENDSVYYTSRDDIYVIENGISRKVVSDPSIAGIVVDGDNIYYLTYTRKFPFDYLGSHFSIAGIKNKLVQFNVSNGNKTVLAEDIITYNKTENMIFYIDLEYSLQSLNLTTNERKSMLDEFLEGMFLAQINISGDRLFFKTWLRNDIEPAIYCCLFDGSDLQIIEYMKDSGASRYITLDTEYYPYSLKFPLGWRWFGSDSGPGRSFSNIITQAWWDGFEFGRNSDESLEIGIGFVGGTQANIETFRNESSFRSRDDWLIMPEDESVYLKTDQGLEGTYVLRAELINDKMHSILLFNYSTPEGLYFFRASARAETFEENSDMIFEILNTFDVNPH